MAFSFILVPVLLSRVLSQDCLKYLIKFYHISNQCDLPYPMSYFYRIYLHEIFRFYFKTNVYKERDTSVNCVLFVKGMSKKKDFWEDHCCKKLSARPKASDVIRPRIRRQLCNMHLAKWLRLLLFWLKMLRWKSVRRILVIVCLHKRWCSLGLFSIAMRFVKDLTSKSLLNFIEKKIK